jgi:2-polyprenyl-3-methyl-5-hydroxy-6-metoxy-1,4-benzoquinol methylase
LLPFLKTDFRILDFGCGEGAFSQRLTDLGFVVDVCDIDTSQIKAKTNSIIQIDLNKENLSDNFHYKYDCIIAMEIIEHIENPWKFMRDISSLLKENGIVLISTPNVANFASRIRFLMRGNLLGFEKENLFYGHITPITPFQ